MKSQRKPQKSKAMKLSKKSKARKLPKKSKTRKSSPKSKTRKLPKKSKEKKSSPNSKEKKSSPKSKERKPVSKEMKRDLKKLFKKSKMEEGDSDSDSSFVRKLENMKIVNNSESDSDSDSFERELEEMGRSPRLRPAIKIKERQNRHRQLLAEQNDPMEQITKNIGKIQVGSNLSNNQLKSLPTNFGKMGIKKKIKKSKSKKHFSINEILQSMKDSHNKK